MSVQGKFIQIGAFGTRQRAEAFANRSTDQLDKEIAITHHQQSGLYKVYINQRFASDQKRQTELTSIQQAFSFRNAFINERGNIQVAAFYNQKSANQFAAEAANTLNNNISVYYDEQNQHYNVFVNEQFNSIAKRRSELAIIKQHTSAYHDAFIARFEDPGSGPSDSENQRAMKFTYQVQIEGVTQQSEKAFFSSLLAPDSDTEIQKPQKDLVVFDQVTTWGEAQELQRKLAKVSSMGHPIVIFIEQSD